MRLGIVLRGAGVHAAACAGVLAELERRQIEPYAVCGLHAAAWPAALSICGYDAGRMDVALCQIERVGAKLLLPAASGRAILRAGECALYAGTRLQRLLAAQTLERALFLCPRRGAFLCRCARTGRRVVFSTHPCPQGTGEIVTTQSSAAFAARAAMARPPFLAPAMWMGAPLLPEADTAYACAALFAMGAQRVLIVSCEPSRSAAADALTFCALCENQEDAHIEHAAVLRVTMPQDAGALDMKKLRACQEAGRIAAHAQLDRMLEQLGMAPCRVLPFRREVYGRGKTDLLL